MSFDINNFVIDEVLSFRLCGKRPSCNASYDFVEDDNSVYRSPEFCPTCGFDIQKYKTEKDLEQKREIENNEYCQLLYDVIGAYECGIERHPQDQMEYLGYKLIDSIPRIISDCWWFTVDKFIEPLPEYLHKMKYTIGQP